jgi:predicted heme/steroid binding protein
VDPAGGGSLTKDGDTFKEHLKEKGLYKQITKTQHIVRFVIGYIHTTTAIMWFGTILYVHLILKPAYAAGGLPRSELLVGWLCIAIMALTGTFLSIARVSSWSMLFHTRFGVLLTIKIGLFLVMVLSATFVTFVIGPKLRKKRSLVFDQQKKELTSDELSQFDGKEGRPAYLALQGNIYDVSSSKLWNGGTHMKRHLAGFDLTDALKAAPHGEDRVLKMPVVGKILKSEQAKKPKLFYFLAYMNLAIVFLIVFVICLWRWW